MIKYFIAVIIALIFFSACSPDAKIKKGEDAYDDVELFTPDLNVNFKEVYSWINLMPGPDAQARFNITGEIEILESKEYDFNNMDLIRINIYQADELIYKIKPEIRLDEKRSANNMKFIIFSTIKGMLPDPRLQTDSVVDVQFIFVHGDDNYSYLIKNLKIDKAY